jgi:TatD DNase family protein
VIDSHCHLADEVFVEDLDAVIERARTAGITQVLCILAADGAGELERAKGVASRWPDVRFAAAVHPHQSGAHAGRVDDVVEVTRAAMAASEAVAVGEIGLDYHYDFAPRAVQRDVFAAQVALAVEGERPVVIHTREAFDDTLAVLRDAGQDRARGVVHCFTGTKAEAKRILDIGFLVSLAGILTFPKASDLREIGGYLPLDRVLVETDAPFLAPVPHRGKRNEPAWVAETLAALAAARGEPVERVEAAVAQNFAALIQGAC